MELKQVCNFIDGKFVKPDGEKYLDNPNPATQDLLAKIPSSDVKDINTAVAAAKQAFSTWSATSCKVRADFLDKIADALETRLEELAILESQDTGKPVGLAKAVDIPRAVSNFRFFAGAIRHDHTRCHMMDNAVNYTQRSAVGVAGLITPWNLPLYLLSWKVAPALAMGNTIVAKPSEVTPMTANALAEIMQQVGLPDGVFNVVHGLGQHAGQALVEHKDTELISFTGGTMTGKKVAATAGVMFKKLSLELGGKNATVVFGDLRDGEELKKAAAGAARAAFANQGQICLCGSRLFIQDTIYDAFMELFLAEVKKLQPGNPSTSNFGSLVSLQHRAKVESYVELAKQEGGTIVCGGQRPSLPAPYDKGAFYLPTVVTGLSPTSRCSTEEIFGPVLCVHTFFAEEEVLQYVNNTQYGLAGSLWTGDVKRAHRFSQRWQTGMVWVNAWLHRDLRVPFGGVKDSGIGREGGEHSLEFYSHTKNICIFTG